MESHLKIINVQYSFRLKSKTDVGTGTTIGVVETFSREGTIKPNHEFLHLTGLFQSMWKGMNHMKIITQGCPQKEKTGYFMTLSKIHKTPTHLTKL